VAYNFQTGKNKIKVLTEDESVLFCDAVLAALMSGKKYDVIPQNGECSRGSNVCTLVFAIRHWLKQFATIETITPQMLENA
jgi:hypothetical protein